MGATFNERESIRRMIDYIVEERSRLWEEYVKAVGRLAKLDEIDREVEKENKSNSEIKITNQLDNLIKETKEKETNSNYPKRLTIEEAIEKHNNNHNYNTNKEDEPKSITEEQIEVYTGPMDNKLTLRNSPTKDTNYRDMRTVTQDLVFILKDKGRPMSIKEIIDNLTKKGISTHSPYSLINQAMEYEPKIERARRGFYQYRR